MRLARLVLIFRIAVPRLIVVGLDKKNACIAVLRKTGRRFQARASTIIAYGSGVSPSWQRVSFVAAAIFALVLAAIVWRSVATQGTMAGNLNHRSLAFRRRRGQLYFAPPLRHFFQLGHAAMPSAAALRSSLFLPREPLPPLCRQPPAASRWRPCSAIFAGAQYLCGNRADRGGSRSSPLRLPNYRLSPFARLELRKAGDSGAPSQ